MEYEASITRSSVGSLLSSLRSIATSDQYLDEELIKICTDRVLAAAKRAQSRPQPSKSIKAPAPKIRSGWFWIFGLSGFWLAYYCTTVYVGWKAAWKRSQELPFDQDADVSSRFDKIADGYDNGLDWMEKVMLLDRLRKRICKKANGHVLEVSAGTGRNASYYDVGDSAPNRHSKDGILSITFVDQSFKMLEVCSEQWKKLHPQFKGSVTYLLADAGSKDAIQPPAGSEGYDTIIQTFGLCSMKNPVKYLTTVGELIKKPDGKGSNGGRIFLLEHGRGHYGWINRLLDGLSKEHADRFGCWWNRDIGQIVEDSGLKIVELKRYHFGTTWLLELSHPDKDSIP